MLLASWNVNSIRARHERFLAWLAARQPDVRNALRHIAGFGLEDTLRLHTQEAGLYSWWDYRQLSFPRNDGLRLDLIYATATVARACTAASIDRTERKGQQPSDHAPVLATFDLP